MRSNIYVADFETSYNKQSNTAWVWAWGMYKINRDDFIYGGSIDTFMKEVFTHDTHKCYFHNLKFDGKFILYWLLKHGYKYVDRVDDERQYTHLIDDMNNYYSIVVGYKHNGKIKRVTFLDSYKKLPSSLDKISKDFELGFSKLEMDYSIEREEDYIKHHPDCEEYEYLKRDCEILKKAIEITEQNGMKKMTIGSNALSEYKSLLVNRGLDFRYIYPLLDDKTDEFLRKAYKGGCTMINPKYANKVIHVHSYDVNSMYPTQLRFKALPYGQPVYYKGKYKYDSLYDLYIQHIRCEFYIKKKKFPCVQVKRTKLFADNEWIENSPYAIDLYLTNMDLELFFETYDVYNLEYIDGYKLRGLKGLFNDYIDKWYTVKCTTTNKSMKTIAKLYLNSLYGKFGTKGSKKSLTFRLENDIIKRDELIVNNVDTVYLPTAIFTTSYARCYLLKCINNNYDNFVYCDTDSIHLTQLAKNIPIDDKKLGYFKHEYSGLGKYLKQKCYLIHYDKEYIKVDDEGKVYDKKLTCAGLNQNLLKESDFEFDNFYVGRVFYKLKLKNVKGGCHLSLEEHVIS